MHSRASSYCTVHSIELVATVPCIVELVATVLCIVELVATVLCIV